MNFTNPKISVVIPAFNRLEKLKKSVNSVLSQTYKNIELIVVDDSSEEDIEGYVLELRQRESRVIYFKNHQNKGVSFSRNFGLQKALGEFVCFLDSDDYFSVDRIAKQLPFLLDHDLMICDYFLLDPTRQSVQVFSQNPNLDLLKRLINRSLHLATLVPIWKKEFLVKNKLRFNEQLRNSEDFLFTVEAILKRPKIHYISEPLASVVRSHQESLTGEYQSKKSTLNKFKSHSRVFILSLGKISMKESALLFKKLIGFGLYILNPFKR